MTITNKQKERLIKSAIAGGLLSGAVSIMYGNGGVTVAGYSVPAAVPLFAAGAGASLITDLIHDQMNMSTTSTQKIADLSSLAIASGLSGAAAVGLLKVSVGLPNESILPVLAVGAASQAGSEYIVHKFLEDKMGNLIMF